jgi:hypothetical protein
MTNTDANAMLSMYRCCSLPNPNSTLNPKP